MTNFSSHLYSGIDSLAHYTCAHT